MTWSILPLPVAFGTARVAAGFWKAACGVLLTPPPHPARVRSAARSMHRISIPPGSLLNLRRRAPWPMRGGSALSTERSKPLIPFMQRGVRQMKTLEVGRHVLVGFAAATMLAGCGALRQAQDDTQPPIGATGAIPQTVAFESAKASLRTGASKSLQVVLDFQHYRGTHPSAPLLDLNGTLYGTTSQGGKYKGGTVYSISPTGAFKTLHYFGEGDDGARPMAGLIDVNGTLYGTTEFGGTSGAGTAYAISTSGSEKVLYNFTNGADGGYPWGPVTNIDGTLYG